MLRAFHKTVRASRCGVWCHRGRSWLASSSAPDHQWTTILDGALARHRIWASIFDRSLHHLKPRRLAPNIGGFYMRCFREMIPRRYAQLAAVVEPRLSSLLIFATPSRLLNMTSSRKETGSCDGEQPRGATICAVEPSPAQPVLHAADFGYASGRG